MIGEEPAYAELFIYQGSAFECRINFKDSAGAAVPLAGSTFAAQIRKSKDASAVVASFATAVSGNSLVLSLSESQTGSIVGGRDKFDPESAYWFDLDWTINSKRKTPIAGKVFVVAEVTR